MTPEQENKLLKELLYCTKRSCNNCGKVNCENFQRQRVDCCGLWVSYKDYIKQLEKENVDLKFDMDSSCKAWKKVSNEYKKRWKVCENKNAELEQENNKLLDVINNQDVKIADLEQQIEKMKNRKVFLLQIVDADDYTVDSQFYTTDEDIAKEWDKYDKHNYCFGQAIELEELSDKERMREELGIE